MTIKIDRKITNRNEINPEYKITFYQNKNEICELETGSVHTKNPNIFFIWDGEIKGINIPKIMNITAEYLNSLNDLEFKINYNQGYRTREKEYYEGKPLKNMYLELNSNDRGIGIEVEEDFNIGIESKNTLKEKINLIYMQSNYQLTGLIAPILSEIYKWDKETKKEFSKKYEEEMTFLDRVSRLKHQESNLKIVYKKNN